MASTRTLLYVDDSTSYIQLIQELLENSVVKVLTASDPHEGLRLAMVTPKLDLILLDIDMPGLTGLDILGQLRGLPRTSRIPVMMLSARQDIETIQRIQALGVSDYLLKPFTLQDLIKRLSQHLGRDVFE